jgi:hypothetical protein
MQPEITQHTRAALLTETAHLVEWIKMHQAETHKAPPEPAPADDPLPDKSPAPDDEPVPDHHPVVVVRAPARLLSAP